MDVIEFLLVFLLYPFSPLNHNLGYHFRKKKKTVSPGLHRQLRVKHTGRNAKLFQEQFEPVAPVQRSNKHQRLALNQPQPQQRVDEQELVLLLTLDAVLLQLAAVRKLGALKLQDHLKENGIKCKGKQMSLTR